MEVRIEVREILCYFDTFYYYTVNDKTFSIYAILYIY